MADLVLLGDSHIVPIARMARDRVALRFDGGPIRAGRDLERPFHAGGPGALRLTVVTDEAIHVAIRRLNGGGQTMLTVMGFNLHRFCAQFEAFCTRHGRAIADDFLPSAVFRAAVLDSRAPVIAFHDAIVRGGNRVFFTTPPCRVAGVGARSVYRSAEQALVAALEDAGCTLVDLRPDMAAADPADDPYLERKDLVHGSEHWGECALKRFLSLADGLR